MLYKKYHSNLESSGGRSNKEGLGFSNTCSSFLTCVSNQIANKRQHRAASGIV